MTRQHGQFSRESFYCNGSIYRRYEQAVHGRHYRNTFKDEFKRLRANTNTSSESPTIHGQQEMTKAEGNNQSPTYSRGWLLDDMYQTIRSKPKADVVLLKMNSDDA